MLYFVYNKIYSPWNVYNKLQIHTAATTVCIRCGLSVEQLDEMNVAFQRISNNLVNNMFDVCNILLKKSHHLCEHCINGNSL